MAGRMETDNIVDRELKAVLTGSNLNINFKRVKGDAVPVSRCHPVVAPFNDSGVKLVHDYARAVKFLESICPADMVYMTVRENDRCDLRGVEPKTHDVGGDRLDAGARAGINEDQLAGINEIHRAVLRIGNVGTADNIYAFNDLFRAHMLSPHAS